MSVVGLVVDGDVPFCRDTCAVLGKAGYLSVPASSARDALAFLDQARPDLILLEGPEDGFALRSRLKRDARYRETPVVVVSTHTVLRKPFSHGVLLETVALLCPLDEGAAHRPSFDADR